MIERLTFRNNSAYADVRVLGQAERVNVDEFGNKLGVEWLPAVAESCVGPAATGTVGLSEKRRVILETSAAGDEFIAIGNTSHHHTLKVSLLTKKTQTVEHVGYVPPLRNGMAGDAISAVINSKQSIVVQLTPK